MPTLLGKEVGATGYGLMGLTRPPKPCSQEQAFTAMRTALSHGANCWNGGEFYGTPEYNSLHLLSRYFEKYPADAEKVVLNIKGGLGPNMVPDGSEKGVRRSVDASLAMLEGKKKLDIFECARVDPKTPIEASMEVLATYVKEGKLGGIGLSEVRAETIRRAHKVHPICSVEVELSLWATEILTNGVAATCAELSIPVLAYSPLGRGFLTGEIRSKADLPDGDIRHRMPRFQDDVFDKNLKLVDELQKLAKKKNCTGAQLALAWVKHLSGAEGMPVIIPIPGATTEERVVENMKDVTLDNADMDEINEILGKAEIHGARYPPAFQHLLDG